MLTLNDEENYRVIEVICPQCGLVIKVPILNEDVEAEIRSIILEGEDEMPEMP